MSVVLTIYVFRFRSVEKKFNRLTRAISSIHNMLENQEGDDHIEDDDELEFGSVPVAKDPPSSPPPHNRISKFVAPGTFDRKNNTNIFHRYEKPEVITFYCSSVPFHWF